jgi:hypothetical protein
MTDDHPRYGRLPLDGDLSVFHRALNFLAADTCAKGRCDPDGQCAKHQQRAAQRRLRAVRDEETGS